MNDTPLKILKIMKKLLFILLALPMLAAAQPVQVTNSCFAGNAFTIKIPVRIPAGASGEYEWYRNDTLIAGTRATLTAGVTVIAYTVPADKAFGDSVLFHFKYNVYENGCGNCGEWLLSPRYVVSFLAICPPIPGVASVAVFPCNGGVTAPGVISVAPILTVNNQLK